MVSVEALSDYHLQDGWPSGVLHLHRLQIPDLAQDLQAPWGSFFFLIWSAGMKAALYVIDGKIQLLPWTQKGVSMNPWSLNSSCFLLSLDNTVVMKVCWPAHSTPVSARPTTWPQSPKQCCILCSQVHRLHRWLPRNMGSWRLNTAVCWCCNTWCTSQKGVPVFT